MRPLSALGIGLSVVFGLLFLALIAEVYYLLWWKRRIASSSSSSSGDVEDGRTASSREFIALFCFCISKPPILSAGALNPSSARITDEDLAPKPYCGEEGMDTELMRLHNLHGPPRILFTIKEETKEDMESEDGRSRMGSRGRSLSDVLLAAAAVETPFMTPLSSPPFLTPPMTPLSHYQQHGRNPLFESKKDDEVNAVRASPPPRFKFLRDAEEKLYRRTLMEEAMRVHKSNGFTPPREFFSDKEENGNHRHHHPHHHHHQSSSQVIPLPSPLSRD